MRVYENGIYRYATEEEVSEAERIAAEEEANQDADLDSAEILSALEGIL